ncbi:MAG: chromate transporter [Clostridia bacterium]
MKTGKLKLLWELFITFFKIGAFTFGGGYAMVCIIEREVVANKKWVTEQDILDMLVIAESTPGVIAVNSATFVGYKVAGVVGGIIATLGVVIPSFIIISLISYFFSYFKNNVWVAAAFKGIRCAVVILIFNAVAKLSKPIKKTLWTITIAVIAFVLATFFNIDVIFIIIAGGLLGIIVYAIYYSKHPYIAPERIKATTEKTSNNNVNNIDFVENNKNILDKSQNDELNNNNEKLDNKNEKLNNKNNELNNKTDELNNKNEELDNEKEKLKKVADKKVKKGVKK